MFRSFELWILLFVSDFVLRISDFKMVGDAGLEPTAFGSGDQRSIQLS